MSTFTRRSFIGKTAVAVGSFAALRDVQLAEWTKEAIERINKNLSLTVATLQSRAKQACW
jgi:hypothetical protein